MGGTLVDNFRHWCRHRWNRLNSPCVVSDVVAPETTSVTFRSSSEARIQASQQERERSRRMCKSEKQRTKNEHELEFFTECGEANRYILQEVIGKGSYGIVCSAIDQYTGEKVAIKKINDIFEHVSDATRILREIKLLRLLRHPDIVELKHIMLPPSQKEFKDIYVVFELMESDLHQVIKANDDLTADHFQFFLYQLLRALKYIHTANVFHRDLKPKNVLANANCKLKVCDFGLARVAFNDTPTTIFWTDYVATRWYRAPELCGSFFSKYTPAVDIWSIGCIFAEILLGKPLFPGKNIVHQLDLITDLLGSPSPEVISRIRNDKARRYLASMCKKPPVPFSQKFMNVDPMALHLLQRLLAFDPQDRPTAEEALSDPYFRGLSKLEREPSAQPINKAEFEFERRKHSKEDVRELIYREILEYYPQILKDYMLGKGCGHFTYPSAAEHLKRQFLYLEDSGSIGSLGLPPVPERALLLRDRAFNFQENSSKHQEKEKVCGDQRMDSKTSKRSSQKIFQGGLPKVGKVVEETTAGHGYCGDASYPLRLFKSSSLNGSSTTLRSMSIKRNPSMRSEVDLVKREQCDQMKVHEKSQSLGFELSKRFQVLHGGLART